MKDTVDWLGLVYSGQESLVIGRYHDLDPSDVTDSHLEATMLAYEELGDSRTSLKIAKQWHSRIGSPLTALRLSWSYLRNHLWLEAIAITRDLEHTRHERESILVKALAYLGIGDCREAITQLDIADSIGPVMETSQSVRVAVTYRCFGPIAARQLVKDLILLRPSIVVNRYLLRTCLINHWFPELRDLLEFETVGSTASVVIAGRLALAQANEESAEARKWARELRSRQLSMDGTLSFAMGTFLYYQKEFKEARKYLQAASSQFEKSQGDVVNLDNVYAFLAATELRLWKPRSARRTAERSLMSCPGNKLAQSTMVFANLYLLNPIGAIRTVLRSIDMDRQDRCP